MISGLPLVKVNDEVFVSSDQIVRFDARAVEFIRESAVANRLGRARICAHKDRQDKLHEMLIAIRSDSYIRPHRHHNKVESFHLVEGAADVVVLGEDGTLLDVIELSKNSNFYYRLDTPQYHTLLVNSPVLVIHEITNGPFVPGGGGDAAAFSPPEGDAAAQAYIEALRKKAIAWKCANSAHEL